MDQQADFATDKSDQTASQSDRQDSEVKPWTVKGVPPEARNAAIAAARRAEQSQGEWLATAILQAVKAERDQSRAVTKTAAAALAPCAMEDVQTASEIAHQISAAAGTKVPRKITRAIHRQLLANLGAA